MLLKWKPLLNSKKLILGSTSIQRKQILSDLGVEFEALGSSFAEDLPKLEPKKYVEATAYHKLLYLLKENPQKEMDFVLTADTIVVLEGKILEKTSSKEEAMLWLKSYSGKKLEVLTSCCFAVIEPSKEGKEIRDFIQFTESSVLSMNVFDEEVVSLYLETEEWKNRAGAIAVQLYGKLLVNNNKAAILT
eukprot:CAMPEP_0170526552 /NCGR_PEP_ID=MMETSP0209-20121228/11945_1 /TAXON_ID=665100 ORGANISM="Litonotus pictus, Strain P1" /NCGR_SAMPLE_ID=MMETSP0209 /ASSEMBLY_ACC=CAM_ASM_000301 /LENGTH=189 /DNA_ID=CAMNT_0010816417 /DNA_START=16 /DNA_END=586 /DNA_ORIENTATION=-